VVIAFAEGAGFQQTCKQNTDCTSVTGDIVCDVRPPIPTFTWFGSFCLSSSNCEKGFSCSFGRCLLGNLKPCSSSNDCASLICFKGNCLGLNLGK